MTGRALHSHHGHVTEWEQEPAPIKKEELVSLTGSSFTGNSINTSFTGTSSSANGEINIEPETKSKKLIFKSTREKWIFGAFILPPLAISFISMLHMVSLFETSNMFWMAVSIAIAVELAAMSSLVALVTLDRLNKTTIWSIFGVLACLQILGNMYHTFINMSPESAQTILNLLAIDNTPWSLRLVNFIVGGILPVISLTFVKGIVDYFKE